MEAQFSAGDRSGALYTYKTFSSLSSRELGTEPGPETKALAAYAQGGASGHGVPQPVAPLVPRPETRRTFLSDMPFVGRSEEFGALVEGYQAALSGETRAVVLLGDAGIGKTPSPRSSSFATSRTRHPSPASGCRQPRASRARGSCVAHSPGSLRRNRSLARCRRG